MAVDAGHVYWTNFNGGNGTTIGRADLNGNGVQLAVSGGYIRKPENAKPLCETGQGIVAVAASGTGPQRDVRPAGQGSQPRGQPAYVGPDAAGHSPAQLFGNEDDLHAAAAAIR